MSRTAYTICNKIRPLPNTIVSPSNINNLNRLSKRNFSSSSNENLNKSFLSTFSRGNILFQGLCWGSAFTNLGWTIFFRTR